MKLGISYIVFDGEELLKYAIKAIRSEVDFISVIYQNISYYGNSASPEVELLSLKKDGLIDHLELYVSDLNLHNKINEINIRNLGLQRSKEAGCTHHISADTDEFYKINQLRYAKKIMEGEYDASIVYLENYYKHPTYQVYPSQNQVVSFIHPVTTSYENIKSPYKIEITRRNPAKNCKIFTKEEFVIHHMSYVRKDIRKKLANNSNGLYYNLDKFVDEFDRYVLGKRLRISPDFLNRRTILADNFFNIEV